MFMMAAIEEAEETQFDVPVGAVMIRDGEIIARVHNQKELSNDVTAHAEILAIKQSQMLLNNWRLDGCTLYVTLEPCPMCAWAIIQSRISTVYFGSYDTKYGALGSALDLRHYTPTNLKVYGGIREERCNKILERFFEKIR